MTTSPADNDPHADGTDNDTTDDHRPEEPPPEGTGSPQDALPPE